MSICCCSLAGSKACEKCPNNGTWKFGEVSYTNLPKKIIEKFDENGKLIERVTEN